jgi:hypothetical protein
MREVPKKKLAEINKQQERNAGIPFGNDKDLWASGGFGRGASSIPVGV